jgi:Right handed beta helix region
MDCHDRRNCAAPDSAGKHLTSFTQERQSMIREKAINSICKGVLLTLVICLTGALVPLLAQSPFGAQPVFSNTPSPNPITYPLTINRPGNYVLARDINVQSGDAITITASGVTLDLNGRQLTTAAPGTGRGIFINGATGVVVKNGRAGSFNSNVMVMNSVNVSIADLQVTGVGLAPAGGPSEIGVQLVNSRGVVVKRNTITSVNLGIFVRGGGSTGNRIFENTLVGGPTPASNLLGICYNPAPVGSDEGPRGDLIYNNHIARFGFAIAISAGSVGNIFRENTLSSFAGGFREPERLVQNGGTNVAEGNLETLIPATALP